MHSSSCSSCCSRSWPNPGQAGVPVPPPGERWGLDPRAHRGRIRGAPLRQGSACGGLGCSPACPMCATRRSRVRTTRFELRGAVPGSPTARPCIFPTETSGRLWDYLGDDLPPMPVPRVREGDQVSERALEEHLELHWTETPFARNGVELARREVHGWPCRQVFTPVNAIDLLGFEPASRRWWVFELKRGRSADRVVGQVSRYLGWIGEERRGNRRDRSRRDHRPEGRSEAPVRREGERSAFTLGVRRSARGSAGRVRRARQPGEPWVCAPLERWMRSR